MKLGKRVCKLESKYVKFYKCPHRLSLFAHIFNSTVPSRVTTHLQDLRVGPKIPPGKEILISKASKSVLLCL